MEFFLLNESIKTFKYNNIRFKEIRKDNIDADLQLIAAKNDWIAFQIVLTDDFEYSVCVNEDPCFSIEGNFDIYRVNVENENKFETSQQLVDYIDADSGIKYADILMDNSYKHYKQSEVCTVWVEIRIPKDAVPGIYSGEITIYKRKRFQKETVAVKHNYKFQVFDYLCKDFSQNSFYLDLWQHNCNIARKSEVNLWSDEHFAIIEKYVKTLADIGQKTISVIVSDAPWSSQYSYNVREYLSDLFEYSCIKVYRSESGEIQCDFSNLEKLLHIYMSNGIDREISLFGLLNIWVDEENGYGSVCKDYPDALRIRCYDNKSREYYYLDEKKDIEAYITILHDFFVGKNLIDKVRVMCDEPSEFEIYTKRIEILKRNAPLFKYKVAVYKPEFLEKIDDSISDIVPILALYASNYEKLQNLQKNNPEKVFLYYVCCWPKYPNTFIESPLIESRIIPLVSFKLNNHGFLRWNYTVWPDKPREKLSFYAPNWFSGDTNFVYPSNNGSPLLSLRYKNLKRGIQEYQLLIDAPKEIQDKVTALIFKKKEIANYYNHKYEDIYANKGALYSIDYNEFIESKKMMISSEERK